MIRPSLLIQQTTAKDRNDDHRMSSYASQNADPIKQELSLDDSVEIN
jgi:hypothetical protein